MIATITHTRRPLWLKLARPFAIAWLRYEIASAEQYLRNSEHCGVLSDEQLAELDRNIGPHRTLLAWWRSA